MATIAVMFKIDADGIAAALQDVREKLDSANGQLVLDLSGVNRINSAGVDALEELANMAASKNVKLTLCGVSVELYKVLKLAKLASRLSFLS